MNNIAQMGHNNPPSESEILQQRFDEYTEEAEKLQALSDVDIPEEITTDDEASNTTDHIKSLKKLKGKVTDIFKKEKAPFLEAGNVANAWKTKNWKEIDDLIETASKPVLAWNNKKEEIERQRQLEIAQKAREEAEALALEAEQHANAGLDDTAEDLINLAVQQDEKAMMMTNNAHHGVVGRSRSATASASTRKPWTGKVESLSALDLDALRNYFSEAELERAVKSAVRDGVRELRGAKIYQESKLTVR